MPRSTILFMDALGVGRLWDPVSTRRLSHVKRVLQRVVHMALDEVGEDGVTEGLLFSDSVAVLCESPATAAALGAEMFRQAFLYTNDRLDDPVWVRGVLVAAYNQKGLLIPHDLEAPKFHKLALPSRLTDAYVLEGTHVPGMRLMLGRKPGSWPSQPGYAVPAEADLGSPVASLAQGYDAAGEYLTEDVVWPLVGSDDRWHDLQEELARREPEEDEGKARNHWEATRGVFEVAETLRGQD